MEATLWMILGALIMLGLGALRSRFADFAAQRPGDYSDSGLRLDLREHLNGAIRCEGVIFGPLGRVASRFDGDFAAEWRGNRGIMHEHFRYDSGNRQDREWRLDLSSDGTIRAEAADLVGPGTGWQKGSAAHLHYRIRLPQEAGGHVLSVTDWMYLTPDGVIVNRSQFRKFGFKVAELIGTMRKVE